MHGRCPPERRARQWKIKQRNDCAMVSASLRHIEKLLRSNVLANHAAPADCHEVTSIAAQVAALASKYEASS